MGTATGILQAFKEQKAALTLRSQTDIVERMEHFSVYSDRLIVLTGDEGSGKSFIIDQLIDQIPREVQHQLLSCKDSEWFHHLLDYHEIDGLAAQQSFHFGLNQVEPESDCLLILDDADDLTIEQIEHFIQKTALDNFHCVVVLSDHAPTLRWLNENPGSVVRLGVEPLSNEESLKLLSFHLCEEEKNVVQLVGEKELENIIKRCKGNPSQLISFAHQLQRSAPEAITEKKFNKVSLPLSIVYLALALLLIVVLIFQDSINETVFSSDKTEEQPSKIESSESTRSIESPFVEEAADKNDKDSSISSGNERDESKASKINRQPQTEPSEAIALSNDNFSTDASTSVGGEPKPNEVNVNSESRVDITMQSESPDPFEDKKIVSKTDIKKATSEKSDTVKPETVKPELSLAEIQKNKNQGRAELPSESVDEAVDVNNDLKTITTRETTLESQSSAFDSKKDSSSTSKQVFTAEEQFLLRQNPEFWMVQLAGFRLLDNVVGFMEGAQSEGEIHFYRTVRDGNDWFVVVMGPFPTKLEADKKRQSLSQSLNSKQPWLKPMKNIQAEIRQE